MTSTVTALPRGWQAEVEMGDPELELAAAQEADRWWLQKAHLSPQARGILLASNPLLLAYNEDLDADALEVLFRSGRSDVLEVLTRNKGLSGPELVALTKALQGARVPEWLTAGLSRRGDLPRDLAQELVDAEVLKSRPSWQVLAECGLRGARVSTTGTDAASLLLNDDHGFQEWAWEQGEEEVEVLLKNPHLSGELVRRGAQSSESATRFLAARNPNLPEDVFTVMMSEPVWWLALNPAIRPEQQVELVRRGGGGVRLSVWQNPSSSGDGLNETLKHLGDEERGSRRFHLKLLEHWGWGPALSTRVSDLEEVRMSGWLVAEAVRRGVDLEDFESLAERWTGTSGELFAVCEELGPDARGRKPSP
jgi:hypothetical protein